MTSSVQPTPQIPPLQNQSQFMLQPRQSQFLTHIHNHTVEAQPITQRQEPLDIENYNEKNQESERKQLNEAIAASEQKKEENAFGHIEADLTTINNQVKFREEIAHNSHKSIQLNFQYQADPNDPLQQFQVHIHKVESRQSFSQNGEQRYQIIFTKSQMNIPLQYKGGDQQTQESNKQKITLLESAACSIRPSEDDDFYVQYLEQKWAKKQREQQQMNQIISNLQKTYQQTQKTPSNSSKTNLTKESLLFSQSHQNSTPTTNHKKPQFKVKKLQDKQTSSVTSVPSHLNTSNKLKSVKLSQNNSQVLDSKNHELKRYKYSRVGRKNFSNFEVSSKKNVEKKQIYKKQIDLNVHYEISLGNAIQMMSQILEDRYYNNGSNKKGSSKVSQNIEQAQVQKKVRKIIKRSPYGLLEIQVKDSRNDAKITNLRILKPKEMIRLKKIPNLMKGNKQNMGQKSIVRLEEKRAQKQRFLDHGLPLLNCNRK